MYLALNSANSKLVGKPRRGYLAALMLPIMKTCPLSCALRGQGCYAELSRTGLHEKRIARLSGAKTGRQIMLAAAKEISSAADAGLAQGRALRLFVSGDARTPAAARAIAKASRRWLAKGGTGVWGYTHAWRDVPRDAWSGLSVLASVENVRVARLARRVGYVPAMVVAEHPKDGRAFTSGNTKWIPCPEQTRGVPCVACRLCWDAEKLAAQRAGITFAAHGTRENLLKRRLPLLVA